MSGGFDERSHMVRADFFKNSGKWGYTRALNMDGLWDFMQVQHAVALAWHRLGELKDHRIVVLEPYHRFGHPVTLTPDQRMQYVVDATTCYDLQTLTPTRRDRERL